MPQVIKHPAPRAPGHKADLYISGRSPFISTVKKVVKLHSELAKSSSAKKQSRTHVTVFASGKAIQKALAVGLKFQNEGHKVDIFTGTLSVLDEHDGEEDSEMKKREISKIEIQIYAKL